MDKLALQYQRMADAIQFILDNFKSQPSLEEIAAAIHMSPAHFQRLFTDWAGTSPKKFLQYISIHHAKMLLSTQQPSLFDVTIDTGLSSTSRLHDLFITIEGMTPAEYKNGGENLTIQYEFADSIFGNVLIASTPIGICHLSFYENAAEALQELKDSFPKAELLASPHPIHQEALKILQPSSGDISQIKLHLKGTPFQLKVWDSLLKIPQGNLTTYGKIAASIGNTSASRAVGTAIGSNPVAYLIPCHRVIQASGILGGYKWLPLRKTLMLGWESAQREAENQGNRS